MIGLFSSKNGNNANTDLRILGFHSYECALISKWEFVQNFHRKRMNSIVLAVCIKLEWNLWHLWNDINDNANSNRVWFKFDVLFTWESKMMARAPNIDWNINWFPISWKMKRSPLNFCLKFPIQDKIKEKDRSLYEIIAIQSNYWVSQNNWSSIFLGDTVCIYSWVVLFSSSYLIQCGLS